MRPLHRDIPVLRKDKILKNHLGAENSAESWLHNESFVKNPYVCQTRYVSCFLDQIWANLKGDL